MWLRFLVSMTVYSAAPCVLSAVMVVFNYTLYPYMNPNDILK